MESSVGSFRTSFSREHSRWIFSGSFEWINSCGVGETSRKIFLTFPFDQITPIVIFW
ncbi:hypothetical protein [Chryseobacterium sp. Y16C]|uniref:hypothetical protein n=1 Tax=Chryseobacterium sp. Y16C TaxID=2920939 RepID=UPI00397AA088